MLLYIKLLFSNNNNKQKYLLVSFFTYLILQNYNVEDDHETIIGITIYIYIYLW